MIRLTMVLRTATFSNFKEILTSSEISAVAAYTPSYIKACAF